MFVAGISTAIFQLEKLYRQYEQSEQILVQLCLAENSLLESALACAGLLPGSRQNANDYKVDFKKGLDEHSTLFKTLSDINPEIARDLARCNEILGDLKNLLSKCDVDPEHVHDSNGILTHRPAAFAMLLEMKPLLNRVHDNKEKIDATLPDELNNQLLTILILTGGGLLFGIGSSIALAVTLSTLVSKRIEQVQENARLFAAGRPLTAVLPGSDEIHELDLALHDAALRMAALRKHESILLDKSSSALCAVDERLRFVEVSESVSKILKFDAEDLRGRTLLSIFDSETASWLKASLQDIKESLRSRDLDTNMRLGDGSTGCIQWKVSYRPEEKRFYCVALDISERRRLLAQKQELLTAAGQDISKPLAYVSDLVRNMSAGGSAALSERTQATLNQVSGNVNRLMALVEDLLDLEKLESGKLTIRKEPVSAAAAVQAAIDALTGLARSLDINVQQSAGDGLIYADKKRLLQVLTNLISNAIKYSPRGGQVAINISRAGSFFEISVIDQGPGIAPAEQELIFEKFYQTRNKPTAGLASETSNRNTAAGAQANSQSVGRSKATPPVKSTGLGLAIAKVLTTAQGGTLGVESAVGRGSRFWLRLPAFDATVGGDTDRQERGGQ